eukprot:gene4868-6889_t
MSFELYDSEDVSDRHPSLQDIEAELKILRYKHTQLMQERNATDNLLDDADVELEETHERLRALEQTCQRQARQLRAEREKVESLTEEYEALKVKLQLHETSTPSKDRKDGQSKFLESEIVNKVDIPIVNNSLAEEVFQQVRPVSASTTHICNLGEHPEHVAVKTQTDLWDMVSQLQHDLSLAEEKLNDSTFGDHGCRNLTWNNEQQYSEKSNVKSDESKCKPALPCNRLWLSSGDENDDEFFDCQDHDAAENRTALYQIDDLREVDGVTAVEDVEISLQDSIIESIVSEEAVLSYLRSGCTTSVKDLQDHFLHHACLGADLSVQIQQRLRQVLAELESADLILFKVDGNRLLIISRS